MEGAVVVCRPYVKSEQQKAMEKHFADIAKRCYNPTHVENSPVVKVRDLELPHIRIINTNERVVRY